MRADRRAPGRRQALTLIELIVVVAIILMIAALGAAFAPTIKDSQTLTRAVDNLEQWLLTAKMRAKRDGLATGLRLIPDPNNPGLYSQFQYIQQPERLSGGTLTWVPPGGAPPPGSVYFLPVPPQPGQSSVYLSGGVCQSAVHNPLKMTTTVTFGHVDFTAGNVTQDQYLVQQGDYLEMLGVGGVYYILGVGDPVLPPPPNSPPVMTKGFPVNVLSLGNSTYDNALSFNPAGDLTGATTNYRIYRQPRLLNGEDPLQLPNNMVVDFSLSANVPQRAVPGGAYYEVLFAPSGAVIGQGATAGKIMFYVRDINRAADFTRDGIVAVQTRNGYIGAYGVAPGANPFLYAEEGRSSGL